MDIEAVERGHNGANGQGSFEDLLSEYLYAEPQRGQLLPGVILEARRDEIILDVGLKRDAVVTRKDLSRLSGDVLATLTPGREVTAFVLQPYNEEGDLIVSINKAMEMEDWIRAQQLMEKDEITDAIVLDVNKGGMLVQFGKLMGFVPNSHIESIPQTTSPSRLEEIKEELIGKTLQLKVIQVETKRNRLILSERAARRAARSERLVELTVGQVVEGRVVNITDFGVFVDIGGVDGMVHISNLDHRHVNHPSDVVSIGDTINVRIDSVDVERERIALNRKATLPDPWTVFTTRYNMGDLIDGLVTNVVDYGIFVAAPGGAQGLVHTSRMTNLGISTPRDMFKEGDPVLVRIANVDFERKHIELSIDDVTQEEQAAWMFARRQQEQAATAEPTPENQSDS